MMTSHHEAHSSFSEGFDSPQKRTIRRMKLQDSESETFRPVTVKQIRGMEPEQEKLKVGDITFQQVTIVAKIYSVKEDKGKPYHEYEVDEPNGRKPIITRISTQGKAQSCVISEGSYVRLYGKIDRLKEQPFTKYILAYNIQLADYNQYACHRGEVDLMKHYYNKRLWEQVSEDVEHPDETMLEGTWFAPDTSPRKTPIRTPSKDLSMSTSMASNTGFRPIGLPAPPLGESLAASITVLSPLDKQIIALLGQHGEGNDEGVTIDTLVPLLERKLSHTEIAAHIDSLAQDGYVYTTDDETHWKVLE